MRILDHKLASLLFWTMDHLSKIFESGTVPINIKNMRFMKQSVQYSCRGHLVRGKDIHSVFNDMNNKDFFHSRSKDISKCFMTVKGGIQL